MARHPCGRSAQGRFDATQQRPDLGRWVRVVVLPLVGVALMGQPQVDVGWDNDQRHRLQVGRGFQTGTHLADSVHIKHDHVRWVPGGQHLAGVLIGRLQHDGALARQQVLWSYPAHVDG